MLSLAEFFHHRLVVFKKKIRSQPAVPAVLAQGGLGHELGKRFAPIRQMGIILTARPFELVVIPFIRIHHIRFSRLDCNRTGGRFQHLRRRWFGQPLRDGIHVHLRHFRGKGFRGEGLTGSAEKLVSPGAITTCSGSISSKSGNSGGISSSCSISCFSTASATSGAGRSSAFRTIFFQAEAFCPPGRRRLCAHECPDQTSSER